MGLNIKKLVALTEQTDVDFKSTFMEQLGFSTNEDGVRTYDKGKAAFDTKSVSFGELDRVFADKLGQRSMTDIPRAYSFQEAAVLPSTFAHISAFDATVAGLLDALIMESYDSVEFTGKQMIGVQTTRTNGGKRVRSANDGQLMGEVPIGQPLPEVGLKEDWSTKPTQKRYGNQIKIDKLDLVYDRTEMIQSKAQNSGYAVGFQIEQIIARMVLGVTNPYIRQDIAGNTYLTTNGASPHDYTNAADLTVVDWNQINSAWAILQSNTDPATGFPINVPTPEIYCMFHNVSNMRSVLFPTGTIMGYSAAIGAGTTRTEYRNPLPLLGVESVKPLSKIWYDILTASAALGGAAEDATKAKSKYLLGRPDRAFKWVEVQPLVTVSAPISAELMARGVAYNFQTETVGAAEVIEPRYIFRSTKA